MTCQIVTKETLLRVMNDVKEIIKNPLENQGIYYKHDDENVLVGYILIIPQDDTPYQYGNYLFKIEFPYNYPYSPPKVIYMTNNGSTRFHPNLYRNGKVCLSLLNTWKGDQWTSCNTLSTVLLSITSIFTNNPLLHEPGIKESHRDFNNYTKIIEYQNFNTAICSFLTDNDFLSKLSDIEPYFRKNIQDNYEKNKDLIKKKIDKLDQSNIVNIEVPFYKMYDVINYKLIKEKLKEYNK